MLVIAPPTRQTLRSLVPSTFYLTFFFISKSNDKIKTTPLFLLGIIGYRRIRGYTLKVLKYKILLTGISTDQNDRACCFEGKADARDRVNDLTYRTVDFSIDDKNENVIDKPRNIISINVNRVNCFHNHRSRYTTSVGEKGR